MLQHTNTFNQVSGNNPYLSLPLIRYFPPSWITGILLISLFHFFCPLHTFHISTTPFFPPCLLSFTHFPYLYYTILSSVSSVLCTLSISLLHHSFLLIFCPLHTLHISTTPFFHPCLLSFTHFPYLYYTILSSLSSVLYTLSISLLHHSFLLLFCSLHTFHISTTPFFPPCLLSFTHFPYLYYTILSSLSSVLYTLSISLLHHSFLLVFCPLHTFHISTTPFFPPCLLSFTHFPYLYYTILSSLSSVLYTLFISLLHHSFLLPSVLYTLSMSLLHHSFLLVFCPLHTFHISTTPFFPPCFLSFTHFPYLYYTILSSLFSVLYTLSISLLHHSFLLVFCPLHTFHISTTPFFPPCFLSFTHFPYLYYTILSSLSSVLYTLSISLLHHSFLLVFCPLHTFHISTTPFSPPCILSFTHFPYLYYTILSSLSSFLYTLSISLLHHSFLLVFCPLHTFHISTTPFFLSFTHFPYLYYTILSSLSSVLYTLSISLLHHSFLLVFCPLHTFHISTTPFFPACLLSFAHFPYLYYTILSSLSSVLYTLSISLLHHSFLLVFCPLHTFRISTTPFFPPCLLSFTHFPYLYYTILSSFFSVDYTLSIYLLHHSFLLVFCPLHTFHISTTPFFPPYLLSFTHFPYLYYTILSSFFSVLYTLSLSLLHHSFLLVFCPLHTFHISTTPFFPPCLLSFTHFPYLYYTILSSLSSVLYTLSISLLHHSFLLVFCHLHTFHISTTPFFPPCFLSFTHFPYLYYTILSSLSSVLYTLSISLLHHSLLLVFCPLHTFHISTTPFFPPCLLSFTHFPYLYYTILSSLFSVLYTLSMTLLHHSFLPVFCPLHTFHISTTPFFPPCFLSFTHFPYLYYTILSSLSSVLYTLSISLLHHSFLLVFCPLHTFHISTTPFFPPGFLSESCLCYSS